MYYHTTMEYQFGLRSKHPTLFLLLVLQETLLQAVMTIRDYTGFPPFFYVPGKNRGISLFVKDDVLAGGMHIQTTCRRNVECLEEIQASCSKSIPLRECTVLRFCHIFITNSAPLVRCGDFSTHHPHWNDPSSQAANKTCRSGQLVAQFLENFQEIRHINPHNPTHVRGGVSDLLFLSSELIP